MRASSRAARHRSPRRSCARSSAPPGARASRQRDAPASPPPAALARAPAQPAPTRHEERKTTPKQPGQPPVHGPIRLHPTTAACLLPTPPTTPSSARRRSLPRARRLRSLEHSRQARADLEPIKREESLAPRNARPPPGRAAAKHSNREKQTQQSTSAEARLVEARDRF